MSEFKHTNPIIDSLSKIDGVSVNYPETNTIKINEEFLQDGQKIPDQLRFRDETLVNAVAALEAKADSDEHLIQGAKTKVEMFENYQRQMWLHSLYEAKAKDISEAEKKLEQLGWELKMVRKDLEDYAVFLTRVIHDIEDIRSDLSEIKSNSRAVAPQPCQPLAAK